MSWRSVVRRAVDTFDTAVERAARIIRDRVRGTQLSRTPLGEV